MTASVAKSPTLLPYDHDAAGGATARMSTSPSSRSAFADVFQLNAATSAAAAKKQTHHQAHLQRGMDSTDVEARRQEKLAADAADAAGPSALAAVSAPPLLSQASEEKSLSTIANTAAVAEAEPQGPFEGPEKLLELWFADCPDLLPVQTLEDSFTILQGPDGQPMSGAQPQRRVGLRAVPRQQWEGMLDIVKCKVLSVIEGADMDAYLLSESSMFVFPHKIILKTCGTTTLLLGLQRLLELARCALQGKRDFSVSSDGDAATTRKDLGALVAQCFYSRKSFMFPERQKGPHKDWMLEVRLLDAFLDNGSAYTVGKMNGDHWLLYMCCPGDGATSSAAGSPIIERPLHLPAPAPSHVDAVMDRTLEILMTHLSPASCAAFEFPADMPVPERVPSGVRDDNDRGHLLGMDLSDKLGLTSLFPNTDLDAFAFDPCGYSANAVIPKSETSTAGYWTIHVTPEEGSSYASFETNVALTGGAGVGGGGNVAPAPAHARPHNLSTLITRVVDIFQPGRMSITLFISSRAGDEEHSSDDGGESREERDDGSVLHALRLPGYTRKDRIAYEFDGYDLVFCHFEIKARAGGKTGGK